MKKFKTWIWETLVGSIANEKHNSCHELLLQRIHECNDLRQQAIELQQEKNAAVKAVHDLTTTVMKWEAHVANLQRVHTATQKKLDIEIQKKSELIAAAVELNKQVATWNQDIENIKNKSRKEWDDATTPKTTN